MSLRSKRKLLSAGFVISSIVTLLLVYYNGQTQRREIHLKGSPNSIKWTHPICKCSRDVPLYSPPDQDDQLLSNCGPAADIRGPNQRVISFAFYGDLDSYFFKGIDTNAKVIPKRYPGWVMRLYHDIPPSNQTAQKKLCDKICDYPLLDDCYVGDLESRIGHDLKTKFKMIWRFAPLGDQMVDILAVRDLDSTIYQREVDAVNEWLSSDKTWHAMRDHPAHKRELLGGGWGVKNSDDFDKMAIILDNMLTHEQQIKYGFDQSLLSEIALPEASKSLLAHDSYHCMEHPHSVPFPTRRHKRRFVFDKPERSPGLAITKMCPVECRPANHKDWTYC